VHAHNILEQESSEFSGGKREILFNIFDDEREVCHEPPLCSFKRPETKIFWWTYDPRISNRIAVKRPGRYNSEYWPTPTNPCGRPACGIRTQPGARNLLHTQALDSRGDGV